MGYSENMTKPKNKVKFCGPCCDEIYHSSEILWEAFNYIVRHYCRLGYPCDINEAEKRIGIVILVKFLEAKGFVTTTDMVDDIIAVKPRHHHFSEVDGHLFCKSIREHFPNFVEANSKKE